MVTKKYYNSLFRIAYFKVKFDLYNVGISNCFIQFITRGIYKVL